MTSRELKDSELNDDYSELIENDGWELRELSVVEPVVAIHGEGDYPGDPGDGVRFYRLDERLFVSMTWDGAERNWFEVDRADVERWLA